MMGTGWIRDINAFIASSTVDIFSEEGTRITQCHVFSAIKLNTYILQANRVHNAFPFTYINLLPLLFYSAKHLHIVYAHANIHTHIQS